MKKALFSLLAIIACFCYAHAQHNSESIDRLLCSLGKQDQKTRLNLNRVVQQGIADSIIHYAQIMALTDTANQQHVQQILKNGVPSDLSAEAYHAIFLIIDHADTKFQKQHFNDLRTLAQQGHIPTYDIATLQDRILMHRNKKQIFGTQTVAKPITITQPESHPEMINYVWAVRNPKHLEKRRTEVGLGSMERQAAGHAKFGYNSIFDPTLSKRDIKRLTAQKKK